MKITFFLGGLSGGGAERFTCNLANYFISVGHSVDIITVGDDGNYELNKQVNRIRLLKKEERKNAIVNSIIRLKRLVKYCLVNNRDIFIVMMPQTTILLLKLRYMVKGRIIAAERSFPLNYSDSTQIKLKKIAKRADAWVFQTKECKEWYHSSIKNNKAFVIPNPVYLPSMKWEESNDNQNSIITAGRLNPVKNHALLIQAFALIKDKHPLAKIIIYGEGNLKKDLIALADNLHVSDRVFFPGFKKWSEDVNNARMFVLSSNLEGMPNALMEAMSLGMPVISTDFVGGAARELIYHKKNGLLVPANNVEAMAEAIDLFLTDSTLLKKCAENARKICDQYTPQVIFGEWEKLILSLRN